MKEIVSNNTMVFLQKVQDEYNSKKCAARASLLFATVNGEYDMENMGYILSQSQRKVNKYLILLDKKSTVDIFCNRELIMNIRQIIHWYEIVTSAGSKITNLIANLPGYNQPVWFD